MPRLRLFFAIDLPEPAHEPLRRAVRALEPGAPGPVRWLGEASYHVTLHFLGKAEESALPPLVELLRVATKGMRPVASALSLPTAFPSTHRARVLVLPLRDDAGELSALCARVQQGAAPLGFAPETRAYKPHVTLARLTPPRDVRPWLSLPPELALPAPVVLDSVTLYHSELGPRGSRYHALATVKLAGP